MSNWKEFIYNTDFSKPNLAEIQAQLNQATQGCNVYPPQEQIFSAFDKTPLDQVRVVILGQDPYHEANQANGLAFSVNSGTKMPPSLRNIFKEIKADLGGELRTNTDLSDWAEQGVLLLNTSLTVIESQANSMAKLLEPFTDSVIRLLNEQEQPIVFVLWGNNARKKKSIIDMSRHYVIESAHPSPLSANRGFFGSKPFSKTNQILKQLGENEICWAQILLADEMPLCYNVAQEILP